MSHMYGRVVAVISRHPEKRTKSEIDQIIPWLQKKSQLLAGLEKDVLFDIVLNCEHLSAAPDEVIIRQGDKGDALYIILGGNVSVYVDAVQSGEEDSNADPMPQHPITSDKQIDKKRDKTQSQLQNVNTDKVRMRHVRVKNGETLGKCVLKLDSGKCFGEIALISEDNIRNATIVADERTDLLLIRRDIYNQTLKLFQEEEYKDRRKFVNETALFDSWSPRFKRLLEMSLVKEVYSFDSPIIKQGADWRGLLFIRRGRVKMMTEPAKHEQQYPELMPFVTENDVFELEHLKFSQKNANRKHGDPRSTQQDKVKLRRREGYAASERRMLHRRLMLCFQSAGEILGDIELVMNLPTYFATVVCMTHTELYVLTTKNFERLVTKKNPGMLDLLKEMVEKKIRNRTNNSHCESIKLLRHFAFKMTEEKQPDPVTLPQLRSTKDLPEKDILFQHLLNMFVENKANLIEPYVPGGIYYREMMRVKAKKRERERIRIEAKTSKRMIPLKEIPRKPRTIAQLRATLKQIILDGRENEKKERLVPELNPEVKPKDFVTKIVQQPTRMFVTELHHREEIEPLEDEQKSKQLKCQNHGMTHHNKMESIAELTLPPISNDKFRSQVDVPLRAVRGVKTKNPQTVEEDPDDHVAENSSDSLQNRVRNFHRKINKEPASDSTVYFPKLQL